MRGYLLTDADPDMVVAAVRTVAAGGRVLGPSVEDRPAVAAPFDTLTPREVRLVVLLADGCTNRQIGQVLGISEKTVRNQTAQVMAKVGVPDRVRPAVLVHRAGLTG